MKNIAYGLLIGLAAILLALGLANALRGTPFLTYVYSDSMDPVIKVNDGFFLRPSRTWEVGDIVTYRPSILEAAYITHRIIGVGMTGYITKGDNAPYSDQASGEPEVTSDRLVGKVVTLFGHPLILPGFGKIPASASQGLGTYTQLVAAILVAIAVVNLAVGSASVKHRRKSHRRWRLKHLYRAVGFLITGLIIVSILLGSRITQIRYLVSDNPGSAVYLVEVNKPGSMAAVVTNSGFLPVWSFAEGLEDVTVTNTSGILWPFSSEKQTLSVPSNAKIGWKQVYVRFESYPVLFPRILLDFFHQKSRFLALFATGTAAFFWYYLFILLISRIPGLQGWVPLRAFRDKVANRRLKKFKARIFGRKQARSRSGMESS